MIIDAPGSPDVHIMTVVVMTPHKPTDDSQLELAVHDIVYVLEQDASGWWGGHKENDERTGWFPGSCVREVPRPAHQALEQAQVISQGGVTEPFDKTSVADEGTSKVCPQTEGQQAQCVSTDIVKLQAEVREMDRSRRQSDVELQMQRIQLMEAETKIVGLERRLEAEAEEKRRMANDAEVLRQQLQRLGMNFERALKEKDEVLSKKEAELRESVALAEINRQVQADALKENRLPEEIASMRKLNDCKVVPEAVAPIVAETASLAQDGALAHAAGDEIRRQLFPSAVAVSARAPTQTQDRSSGESMQLPSNGTADAPTTDSLCVQAEPAVAALARPRSPAAQVQPGLTAQLRSTAQRPPEAPRSASCTRAPSRSWVPSTSPGGLSGVHSTGALPGTPTGTQYQRESPPQGCVKGIVSVFEQRCQTPRHTAPMRAAERASTPSRNARVSLGDQPKRALPAASLPHALVASPARNRRLSDFDLLVDQGQDDCLDEQVTLNMSPMRSIRPDVTTCAGGPSTSVSSNEPTETSPSLQEVSVKDRVRQFAQR